MQLRHTRTLVLCFVHIWSLSWVHSITLKVENCANLPTTSQGKKSLLSSLINAVLASLFAGVLPKSHKILSWTLFVSAARMHSIFFLHLFPLLVIRPHFKWTEVNVGTYFHMHQYELPCSKRYEILKTYCNLCWSLDVPCWHANSTCKTPQVSVQKKTSNEAETQTVCHI